jgi:hypothetical protein
VTKVVKLKHYSDLFNVKIYCNYDQNKIRIKGGATRARSFTKQHTLTLNLCDLTIWLIFLLSLQHFHWCPYPDTCVTNLTEKWMKGALIAPNYLVFGLGVVSNHFQPPVID